MRTLRLSLAGTVILALLGGLSGAVVAQDADATVSQVTGKVISESWSGPASDSYEGSINHMLDLVATREVEWSDPRLPSSMTTRINMDDHPLGSDGILTWAQTHRLDGPDGAWTATERGFMEPVGSFGLMVWTGDGAYEGLSALLVGKVTETGDTLYEGFVFDGELPAMPKPVEPPAE